MTIVEDQPSDGDKERCRHLHEPQGVGKTPTFLKVRYAIRQRHRPTFSGAVGLPVKNDIGNDRHGVTQRSQGQKCTAAA